MTICTLCFKDIFVPYRVYSEQGRVIEGCVGEGHTDRLVTPSESSRWHYRSEAKKIRANLRKMGQKVFTREISIDI